MWDKNIFSPLDEGVIMVARHLLKLLVAGQKSKVRSILMRFRLSAHASL